MEATSTARFIKDIPYATEMRPGMYVYNDRGTMLNGAAREEDCAIPVFATVVSRPSRDRMIIDAGSKTLAREPGENEGFGYVKGHDELVIQVLSEEHGAIEIRGETDLKVGDVIEIILIMYVQLSIWQMNYMVLKMGNSKQRFLLAGAEKTVSPLNRV